MDKVYFEGEEFQGINYSEQHLLKGEYESCTFINCSMSDSDLSDVNFGECEFIDCDLSLATLNRTAFREVKFTNCKLLGLHFDQCNDFLFVVSFFNCQLNLSSFYQRSLKKTLFQNCQLQEVDFAYADLTQAIFEKCDLLGATFENTNLEKANLSSAYNFNIDPELNAIQKAKFSKENLAGLLWKYNIDVD